MHVNDTPITITPYRLAMILSRVNENAENPDQENEDLAGVFDLAAILCDSSDDGIAPGVKAFLDAVGDCLHSGN